MFISNGILGVYPIATGGGTGNMAGTFQVRTITLSAASVIPLANSDVFEDVSEVILDASFVPSETRNSFTAYVPAHGFMRSEGKVQFRGSNSPTSTSGVYGVKSSTSFNFMRMVAYAADSIIPAGTFYLLTYTPESTTTS